MRHRTLRKLAAAVAFLALVGAACGDDDDDTGEATGDAEAAGEPIKYGAIIQNKGSASVFPDIIDGVESAIGSINDDGGVNGRRIELVMCETDGTPEASQRCANEMVQAEVVAVQAFDYGAPAGYPIINAAKIPWIPTLPIAPHDYSGSEVFSFFGGSAGQFAGQVKYINETLEAKKVAILVLADPPGPETAEGLLKVPLEALGIEVEILPASTTAPDYSAPLTALSRAEPDVFAILMVGPPCGKIMSAYRSLGLDKPIIFPSSCGDKEFLAAAAGGDEGGIFTFETMIPEVHPDDPEVQLYVDAMEQYSGRGEDDLTAFAQVGFATAYNMAKVFERVDGEITPASVVSTLAASVGEDNLMGDDYTCDGSAIEGFPTICNASVRILQREEGQWTELSDEWLRPS